MKNGDKHRHCKKIREAIVKARTVNLDVVEVSKNAIPPVAQIMDYGKYQYGQNKLKKREARNPLN